MPSCQHSPFGIILTVATAHEKEPCCCRRRRRRHCYLTLHSIPAALPVHLGRGLLPHTGPIHADLRVIPLMLLASSVNTPIPQQKVPFVHVRRIASPRVASSLDWANRAVFC